MIKRTIWWLIKLVCGVVTAVGAFLMIGGIMFLVPLLAGWVQPDHEIPPVSGASVMLIVGLIQTIVGYKAPTWLNIDRLLT